MSFIYDFADNTLISAENLNGIASGIGEGTIVSSQFEDNVTYAVNKLNCIRSDILNPGIVCGMKCSYENGNISVLPGVAFFKNGMRIEITEKETFPAETDNKLYVYLYASESFNCAMPVITTAEKTSDAYIPVATVDKYGEIEDKRVFSTSKIPLASGSAVQKINIQYDTVENTTQVSKNKRTHTINLKDKYFSYVIFDVTISGKKASGVSNIEKINGYFKRSSGLCYGIYDGKSYVEKEYIGIYNINSGVYVKPVFENGVFKVMTDCINNIGTFKMSLEVI